MSDGHYHSVPSAEACQQDCQVDPDEDLDHDGDGDLEHGVDGGGGVGDDHQDCQVPGPVKFLLSCF